MAQIKDKVGSFFSWARAGRQPVSVEVARREKEEAASKEVTLQQLKQGYGEVVETMKSVRTHLEEQAHRNGRMLELMEGLPDVLRAIPESTRAQAKMMEALQQHLERQGENSRELSSAITGLASTSDQQHKALSAIREHLADEGDTRGRLNQGVTALNDTLGHVMDSNAATRDSLGSVVEQTRVNDERMRTMFQRSQKMNTAMVLLCLALATGALALGGYMAVLVSRVVDSETNAPAVTSVEAPAPATLTNE